MSKKIENMLRIILENQCKIMLILSQMKRGEFGDGFESRQLILHVQQTQRTLHSLFMPQPKINNIEGQQP